MKNSFKFLVLIFSIFFINISAQEGASPSEEQRETPIELANLVNRASSLLESWRSNNSINNFQKAIQESIKNNNPKLYKTLMTEHKKDPKTTVETSLLLPLLERNIRSGCAKVHTVIDKINKSDDLMDWYDAYDQLQAENPELKETSHLSEETIATLIKIALERKNKKLAQKLMQDRQAKRNNLALESIQNDIKFRCANDKNSYDCITARQALEDFKKTMDKLLKQEQQDKQPPQEMYERAKIIAGIFCGAVISYCCYNFFKTAQAPDSSEEEEANRLSQLKELMAWQQFMNPSNTSTLPDEDQEYEDDLDIDANLDVEPKSTTWSEWLKSLVPFSRQNQIIDEEEQEGTSDFDEDQEYEEYEDDSYTDVESNDTPIEDSVIAESTEEEEQGTDESESQEIKEEEQDVPSKAEIHEEQ